jgi:hypothetical protein
MSVPVNDIESVQTYPKLATPDLLWGSLSRLSIPSLPGRNVAIPIRKARKFDE